MWRGGVFCSHLLAGDASPWWKPWHLLCSEEFDHVQKVRVFIPGPHHLDDFCEERVKAVLNERANSCLGWVLLLGSGVTVTFHFHVELLLQLRLLLQCLLWNLGGAREADDDDADVIQAALQGETECKITREALQDCSLLLKVLPHYLCISNNFIIFYTLTVLNFKGRYETFYLKFASYCYWRLQDTDYFYF